MKETSAFKNKAVPSSKMVLEDEISLTVKERKTFFPSILSSLHSTATALPSGILFR